MLNAAPAYSASAGILGGFVFLSIITLITVRSAESDASLARSSGRSYRLRVGQQSRRAKREINRGRALMLFLPALIDLLVSSFLFGEVTGEQSCVRGYIEGVLSASLLAIGALAVFIGIVWMLDSYGESFNNLRQASEAFTVIAFLVIVALLAVSGWDVVNNAFNGSPPAWAEAAVIAYGPLLLIALSYARHRLTPGDDGRQKILLTAVYAPAAYLVLIVVLYAILTSYSKAQWHSFNDWKAYLSLAVGLFCPGIIMIVYASALPNPPVFDVFKKSWWWPFR